MRMYDIILKKRRGEELTDEEIRFFVDGYTRGEIPDYQASAFCMAVCFRGMSESETFSLTKHMMYSGDTVDLSALTHTVDKHSTGGVGDKTSLIVAPTAASLGLSVAKMSGRGLGHTGGTIDKLESIPGYRTSLTEEEFLNQVKKIGVAVIGQTGNLAPADKKLYALRDVTATVDSLPLIVSSIMSKKLAAGAENIVLDVKYGSGAFMKTPDDAKALASEMVKVGASFGRKVSALITDMDKPLGNCVGNSLEVIEAVKVLRGEEKGELYELCVNIVSEMYSLAMGSSHEEALALAENSINSGKAYEKMLEWVSAQGGDVRYIEENTLPVGEFARVVRASEGGFISHIDAEKVGMSASLLGAGRISKTDRIDYGAGVMLQKNTGDHVRTGDEIAVMYSGNKDTLDAAEEMFVSAIEYSDTKPNDMPLIYGILKG
mgnify:FL=1